MVAFIKNLFVTQVYADEIINRALPLDIASKTPSEGLAFYIAILWRSIVTLGGVAFIIFLIWGGISWLTAGGDKGQVENAQKMISSAFIGLAILIASYAIALFVQNAFKINILAPVFPSNL